MGAGDARRGAGDEADASTLQARELLHDLRNLGGLVWALVEELPTHVQPIHADGDVVLGDLRSQIGLMMNVLHLLDHWNSHGPKLVSLGAWAWSLRLRQREVFTGEHLGRGAHVLVLVPALMAAGARLVSALGRGSAVSVDSDERGAVTFEGAPGSSDQDALDGACEALAQLGLRVSRETPSRVRVSAGAETK